MDRRVLPAIAAVLIVLGIAGIAMVWAIGAGTPGTMRGGDMDRMFIREMVPHHEDAIEMADMALRRAEHEEVRELAEIINRDQSAENEQMREWYEAWYDQPVPQGGGMMGPMMGRDMDMEALEGADPFDKAFIEAMIPHHQMAIRMASMARRGTNRPEMRRLYDSIVESQSEQIEQMRDLYEEWYGR